MIGFPAEAIEIHKEPQALYGYQGDIRSEKAHIIIRRQNVGTAANDLGWERQPDGTYRAWISEYDEQHAFLPARQDKLKQEYAVAAVTQQQMQYGRKVSRRLLPNGKIELEVRGFR